jgi:hypothetical protein
MPDIATRVGFLPIPGTTIEGTVHRKLEFAVVWGEIPGGRRPLVTDEQVIDGGIQAIQDGMQASARIQRGALITVSGFPARDATVIVPGEGEMVIRFVVAQSRVYIVAAGARGGKVDQPDVRHFLDTFEITDTNLLAALKERAAAAERARKAEEEQREIDRQRLERLAEEERLRDVARRKQEALAQVAGASEAVGSVAYREVDKVLEHIELLQRIRDAAAIATQASIGRELDYLRDLPVFVNESGMKIAQKLLAIASAESEAGLARARTEVFEKGLYTGGKPADPADISGLVLHLGFDDAAGKGLAYGPSGKTVPLPADAKLGPGVRGTALYLAGKKQLDLSGLSPLGVTDRRPITISLWFKARADKAELCRFMGTGANNFWGYGIAYDKEMLFCRAWEPMQEAFPVRHIRDNSTQFTADGKWHHVAMIHEVVQRNPSVLARYDLYLDGVRVARQEVIRGFSDVKIQPKSVGVTAETSFRIPNTDPVLAVETLFKIPDNDALLAIDDLCVYDRALKELDIRALAGLGSLAVAPAPRLAPGLEFTTVNPTRPNSFAAFDIDNKTLWMVENVLKPAPVGQPKPKDDGPVYLLRYELPTSTMVGKYELPTWGYLGILNPKTNQLYLAVSADGDRWRPSGYGELHLFDLAELKPNDGSTVPKLKPRQIFSTKTQFCDFAISPDGKFIHAIGHTSDTPIPKFQAYRFNPDLRGRPDAVELPDATLPGRFILDAAGKNLVLSAGKSGHYPPTTGLRFEIDRQKWEIAASKPLPWGGSEWVEAGGKIYSTVGHAPGASTFTYYDETGTRQKVQHMANHVCKTPDGKYVFMTGFRNSFAGFSVYSPTMATVDGLPAPMNDVRDPKVAELYGPMTMSPDGKWISFRSGSLLRLWGTPVEQPPGFEKPASAPPANPNDIRGLVFHLACEELGSNGVKDSVSGKSIEVPDDAALIDGVLGQALRLVSHTTGKVPAGLELSGQPAFVVDEGKPFTLAFWSRIVPGRKERGTEVQLLHAETAPTAMTNTTFTVTRNMMNVGCHLSRGPKQGNAQPTTRVDLRQTIGKWEAWMHVAVVRDEKNVIRLYVNGVAADDPLATAFPSALKFHKIYVLQRELRQVTGDIDELCMFNRALTEDELKMLAGVVDKK